MTEQENAELWVMIASVHGFNELAMKATTLGERVFFRIARAQGEKRCADLGVKFDVSEENVVMTIQHRPDIHFYERDIELMRECVRNYDEEHALNGLNT